MKMHRGDDMKKGALFGAAYGILLVLLSRGFIRNLGELFSPIGKIIKLDGELVKHIIQVLEQFKTAKLVSPWLFVLKEIKGLTY